MTPMKGLVLAACTAVASCSMDSGAPAAGAGAAQGVANDEQTGSSAPPVMRSPAMVDRPAQAVPMPEAHAPAAAKDHAHMRMAEAAGMAEVPLEPCSVLEGAAYNACTARNAQARRGRQ